MIVGIPPKTYAIYKREFYELKRKEKIKLPRVGDEKFTLHLWTRDPKVLMQNDYVDPISLYFTERNSTDERVQNEINRLIADLGLKESEFDFAKPTPSGRRINKE